MTCPICKKITSQSHRPFCSARCKDVDLSKWLISGYVIANENENDNLDIDAVGEGADG
tara:strand:- start:6619 stop:6792 length:174 start_codon:yes stop_codon:yes gene_type:complete